MEEQKSFTARQTLDSKAMIEGLSQIAKDLQSAVDDAKAVVIYGSSLRRADPGDIDLAIITDGTTDRFEALRTISPILAQYSIRRGLLTTCFPIDEADFTRGGSQYLKNVRAGGLSL